ncbi:MAG: hypothetical protein ACK4M1_07750 [Flavobacterium sp.]
MTKIITLFILFLFSSVGLSQQLIQSGEYDNSLRMAYDSESKKITGYYENYTGWDEETKAPRFSCIFYIEGTVSEQKVKIKTYYPEDKNEDTIEGHIEIANNETIYIVLPEEHGGCWNVQHFADKPDKFELIKKTNWIQIRYVDTEKSYFHKSKSDTKKQKPYVIKGDIVYVEKIEGDWALCSYFDKKTTKGWLKVADLNQL